MNEKINNLTKSTKWSDSPRVAVDSTNITWILHSVCSECPVHINSLDECCDAPKDHVWVTIDTAKMMYKKLESIDIKEKNFNELKDKVEEFIAEHELKNSHYLTNKEILAYFSEYKEKKVKKAIKELR